MKHDLTTYFICVFIGLIGLLMIHNATLLGQRVNTITPSISLDSTCVDIFDHELDRMKFLMRSHYGNEISLWLSALDLYDRGITAHTLRVTARSLVLGRFMGLSEANLRHLQYGTVLHDIGKLGIPEKIIQKPGKLTSEEYDVVKEHPVYAFNWLKRCSDHLPANVIPLYHHERWDGMGYPQGLSGENIPLLARIVAVVDVYDAVTSDRVYCRAISKNKAMALIQSESGKQFDPYVVKAFSNLGIDGITRVHLADALIV